MAAVKLPKGKPPVASHARAGRSEHKHVHLSLLKRLCARQTRKGTTRPQPDIGCGVSKRQPQLRFTLQDLGPFREEQ